MINFLPQSQTPIPRTPTMIRKDKVLNDRQAPFIYPMVGFYAGIAIMALVASLFLI